MKKPLKSRRNFIAKTATGILGGLAIAGSSDANSYKDLNIEININGIDPHKIYKPLDELNLVCDTACEIRVYDAEGRNYFSSKASKNHTFIIGGALGTHQVIVLDNKGVELQRNRFKVGAQTKIEDSSGAYKKLFTQLYWTMVGSEEGADMGGRGGEAFPFLVEGKFYFTFVPWLRDHVHTLKGMKYFYPELKSGIDLYANYQREDGMIWDNVYKRKKDPSMWDKRFSYGGFIKSVDEDRIEFKRIPVEADMEYLFIEGIYFTWQATGDTAWMKSRLDNALKAVQYATTDVYRWSQKYQLIKRGFTIDTWDFMAEEDTEISGGDHMCIDKDKTRFGIMYGDNTGFINACLKLAQMLEIADRKKEAESIQKLASDMQERLNKIAWNGSFYTHHVPEDTNIKRDYGVDLNAQVSLSNAYSINRGIGSEKSIKIIQKYKEIYQSKPSNSLGEWYGIYPPFTKGFGDTGAWEYVNGGVLSLVAGELAHGAFQNGEEAYATDILSRISALASKHNGFLHGSFKGLIPEAPLRTFQTIALEKYNNVSFSGENSGTATPWTKEGANDLHEMVSGKHTFHDIPFEITVPEKNNFKACIGIAHKNDYYDSKSIAISQKAGSIYFLHIKAGPALAGYVKINYQDGSSHVEEIGNDRIDGWWMPNNKSQFKVAWKGKNIKAPYVGVGVCGINNPFPDKDIKEIVLEHGKNTNTVWFVLGITLSDAKVYFKPHEKSYGIPDRWGAAACMYGLVEGMVGATDTGIAFSQATISPRWAVSNENKVNTTIKYESSEGYVAYEYKIGKNAKVIQMICTGNAQSKRYEILLPKGSKAKSLKVNGKTVDKFLNTMIQQSNYVVWQQNEVGVDTIEIQYI
jgi:hypothetical protein